VIALAKLDEPAVLAANKASWTADFAADKNRRDYAHPDIQAALKSETHTKCAYCEARMEHVSYGNVEHMKPKQSFPELVCEWTNLTLACTVCNTNKGTHYEAGCPMLNPYLDDPDDHLLWVGPLVLDRTPDRGRLAIGRLKLNRSPLLFARAEALDRVNNLLGMMDGASDSIRLALEESINDAQQATEEYSAAVAAFVAYRRAA
jgi:hypothetical protein